MLGALTHTEQQRDRDFKVDTMMKTLIHPRNLCMSNATILNLEPSQKL